MTRLLHALSMVASPRGEYLHVLEEHRVAYGNIRERPPAPSSMAYPAFAQGREGAEGKG